MLGIDALGVNAGRKQRGETQDCHPERFGTNWHSHSAGPWGGWKGTVPLIETTAYHNATVDREPSKR